MKCAARTGYGYQHFAWLLAALALQFFQHFMAEFIAVAVSKRDVTR